MGTYLLLILSLAPDLEQANPLPGERAVREPGELEVGWVGGPDAWQRLGGHSHRP